MRRKRIPPFRVYLIYWFIPKSLLLVSVTLNLINSGNRSRDKMRLLA